MRTMNCCLKFEAFGRLVYTSFFHLYNFVLYNRLGCCCHIRLTACNNRQECNSFAFFVYVAGNLCGLVLLMCKTSKPATEQIISKLSSAILICVVNYYSVIYAPAYLFIEFFSHLDIVHARTCISCCATVHVCTCSGLEQCCCKY